MVMADKIRFELVSPERLLYADEVDMVVLPAADGDMGVLPGHAPVIAAIRPGTICIFTGEDVSERVFVSGGFVEVTPERCTVLGEEAEAIAGIDQAALRQHIAELSENVARTGDEDTDTGIGARTNLAVAEAKLHALENPAYRR